MKVKVIVEMSPQLFSALDYIMSQKYATGFNDEELAAEMAEKNKVFNIQHIIEQYESN